MTRLPYFTIRCSGVILLMLLTAPFPAAYGDDESPADSGETLEVDVAAHLVLVSYQVNGEKRSGHGVIVEMDGKPYLLTNQHHILGVEKLSFSSTTGEKLSPRSIELSNSRDLARLALPADKTKGLKLSTEAKMNTPVSIILNEDGEGLAEEQGNIIGVGSTKLEISAAFDATGNGAPVLNDAEEVVGVTTYSRESSFNIHKSGSRFQDSTRYFCTRMGKGDWKRVNWKAYNNKFGKAFRQHDIFYEQLMDLFDEWQTSNVSAEKADKLSRECRTHARQLRKLEEQQGLTDFLRTYFEDKADFFEGAGEALSKYVNHMR